MLKFANHEAAKKITTSWSARLHGFVASKFKIGRVWFFAESKGVLASKSET